MATSKDDILLASLETHKRTYDQASNIYDQLRIKSMALLAGEVAFVTFLFSGWDFWEKVSGGDRYFLFFTGVALLLAAFALLLWIVSTVTWLFPHDMRSAQELQKDKNYRNTTDFLEYLHDDYIKAVQHNRSIVGPKCKKFNWAIFMIAAGVIIIMVIKFGGPQI